MYTIIRSTCSSPTTKKNKKKTKATLNQSHLTPHLPSPPSKTYRPTSLSRSPPWVPAPLSCFSPVPSDSPSSRVPTRAAPSAAADRCVFGSLGPHVRMLLLGLVRGGGQDGYRALLGTKESMSLSMIVLRGVKGGGEIRYSKTPTTTPHSKIAPPCL